MRSPPAFHAMRRTAAVVLHAERHPEAGEVHAAILPEAIERVWDAREAAAGPKPVDKVGMKEPEAEERAAVLAKAVEGRAADGATAPESEDAAVEERGERSVGGG